MLQILLTLHNQYQGGKMEHAHNVEVGDDKLKELMKGRDTRWYRGHLLKLNTIILLLLITSANNGYDGSMMNGLQ